MTEIKNATITSTTLGLEDQGIFTFWLHLDYGGTAQGFGGYALDEPLKSNEKFVRRQGTAFGADALLRILKVVGVTSWEKLPGTPIRVRSSTSHNIEAIGHYLKEDWLNIKQLAIEYEEGQQ